MPRSRFRRLLGRPFLLILGVLGLLGLAPRASADGHSLDEIRRGLRARLHHFEPDHHSKEAIARALALIDESGFLPEVVEAAWAWAPAPWTGPEVPLPDPDEEKPGVRTRFRRAAQRTKLFAVASILYTKADPDLSDLAFFDAQARDPDPVVARTARALGAGLRDLAAGQ